MGAKMARAAQRTASFRRVHHRYAVRGIHVGMATMHEGRWLVATALRQPLSPERRPSG
jgi:hypothetical protein